MGIAMRVNGRSTLWNSRPRFRIEKETEDATFGLYAPLTRQFPLHPYN